MKRTLTALAALALIALGGMFAVPQTLGFDAQAQEAADIDTSMIKDMSIGNPDATVTIIEYASFTCPHCASFHANVFKDLKADYIDTGKINFIHREIYFDRFGLWAGIVARCGENAENRYFGIADMIYEQQATWARQDDPNAIVASLRNIGKTAGLSDAELDACFQDADKAQALYATFVKNSEADNITSTPSFVINGEKYSNMAYPELQQILDAALGS
ncbi:MAG: DsbA family protein [Silicimonas sp.]|nr:DsbA family protein [Silicimonas sp.]